MSSSLNSPQITGTGDEAPALMFRPGRAHSRYLETSAGRTFVPLGLNLCFPRFDTSPADGLARYERWFDALAANGGNFARLWIGHPFFDIEPGRAGVFAEEPALRLDAVLAMAHERGIAVKLTLEHFRTISPRREAEIFPGAASFSKPLYAAANGGFADDMADFLDNPECRRRYLKKLDRLAGRYAGHPAIFGWELWNEMNAVAAAGWLEWTRAMLPELRRRFPRHLVMQSLGSFDCEAQRAAYAACARLPVADLAQVHRYLDPGAELTVCRGPMDALCADAVSELRRMAPGSPVILAECGAVEAHHARPSDLYERDREGVLLHDMLFAPFFAGAAGPGQSWHWDFYVERHALWWHFGRFARAISGFDPIEERAEPLFWETPRLRVHALRGRRRSLLWLRDKESDWDSELVAGRPPAPASGLLLSLPPTLGGPAGVDFYEPWSDRWQSGGHVGLPLKLPEFLRSLVVRLDRESPNIVHVASVCCGAATSPSPKR
ncbi:MAG: hypothetical protein WC661_05070 [Opitutaceae bacterium]|jgi:hypothetical protein